jgi:hypothetical protein
LYISCSNSYFHLPAVGRGNRNYSNLRNWKIATGKSQVKNLRKWKVFCSANEGFFPLNCKANPRKWNVPIYTTARVLEIFVSISSVINILKFILMLNGQLLFLHLYGNQTFFSSSHTILFKLVIICKGTLWLNWELWTG